jgi:hypothetical protein
LAMAPGRMSFGEITRQDAARWLEICGTTTAARLPLLILAPIAVAYEHAMTQNEGRNTWRTDRYSPCPRAEAAGYLGFLASVGYELTPIERAVAGGMPWTGDAPAGSGDDVGTDGRPGPDVSGGADAQSDMGDQTGEAAA